NRKGAGWSIASTQHPARCLYGTTFVTLMIRLLPNVTGGSGGRGWKSLVSLTLSVGSAIPRPVTVDPPTAFTVTVSVADSPGPRLPKQSDRTFDPGVVPPFVLHVIAGFDEVGTGTDPASSLPNTSKNAIGSVPPRLVASAPVLTRTSL